MESYVQKNMPIEKERLKLCHSLNDFYIHVMLLRCLRESVIVLFGN